VESESEGILGGVGRNFRWSSSRSRKELKVELESGGNFRWSRTRSR
jgi:hypothetical protein